MSQCNLWHLLSSLSLCSLVLLCDQRLPNICQFTDKFATTNSGVVNWIIEEINDADEEIPNNFPILPWPVIRVVIRYTARIVDNKYYIDLSAARISCINNTINNRNTNPMQLNTVGVTIADSALDRKQYWHRFMVVRLASNFWVWQWILQGNCTYVALDGRAT